MKDSEKERGAKSIKENEEYGRSTIEEDIYFRQRKLQEKQRKRTAVESAMNFSSNQV